MIVPELRVCCRAKVNLTLDVLERRPDGYHNLESVVQPVDLADILWVRKTAGREVEVTADRPDVPSGHGNTVYTACLLFKEAAGIDAGIAVTIEKRIPHQAGLGGGSSDAAGVLLALNELFGSPLPMEVLARLAAQIGSDVPYFLAGGTALVSGRGDMVEKLPNAPCMDLVIVKPDIGVSTAWAYKRLDEVGRHRSTAATAAVVDAIRRGDRGGIIKNLSNDFWGIVAAEFPVVAEIEREMGEHGAEGVLLCGSGAAVFGVFPGVEEAQHACKTFKSRYPFAVAISTTPAAITIGDGKHAS